MWEKNRRSYGVKSITQANQSTIYGEIHETGQILKWTCLRGASPLIFLRALRIKSLEPAKANITHRRVRKMAKAKAPKFKSLVKKKVGKNFITVSTFKNSEGKTRYIDSLELPSGRRNTSYGKKEYRALAKTILKVVGE
jgi:hypothetical protein